MLCLYGSPSPCMGAGAGGEGCFSPHPLAPSPTEGRRGTGQVAAPPRPGMGAGDGGDGCFPVWERGQGERVCRPNIRGKLRNQCQTNPSEVNGVNNGTKPDPL